MTRLRVALFRSLSYEGTTYRSGEEFDVPDTAAAQWLSTGLVLPADGKWPEGAQMATEAASADPQCLPAAKPGEYVAHDPCEPGPRPTGKRRAISVCPVAGCPCQTWAGECAECKRIHNRHRTRRNEHKAYRRKDWQVTRRAYLNTHPLCECSDCALTPEPLRQAASVVDHTDGLGPLGPRGHDPSNLRAMAKRCHDRRTMREQVNGS